MARMIKVAGLDIATRPRPMPAGDYVCMISEIDDTKTVKTGDYAGTPKIVFILRPVDEEFRTKKLQLSFMLNEVSLPYLRAFLEDIGVLNEGDNIDEFDADGIDGKEVRATVGVMKGTGGRGQINTVDAVSAVD